MIWALPRRSYYGRCGLIVLASGWRSEGRGFDYRWVLKPDTSVNLWPRCCHIMHKKDDFQPGLKSVLSWLTSLEPKKILKIRVWKVYWKPIFTFFRRLSFHTDVHLTVRLLTRFYGLVPRQKICWSHHVQMKLRLLKLWQGLAQLFYLCYLVNKIQYWLFNWNKDLHHFLGGFFYDLIVEASVNDCNSSICYTKSTPKIFYVPCSFQCRDGHCLDNKYARLIHSFQPNNYVKNRNFP